MDIALILHWVEQYAHTNQMMAYLLLALFSVIENVFPPIPGDTLVIFGAFLVGRGVLEFYPTVISTTVGGVIGFILIYYLGYRIAFSNKTKKSNRLTMYFSSNPKMKYMEDKFHRFGYWLILFNRFLAGIRSIISFWAGLSRLNFIWVGILAFCSSMVWNLLLIFLGLKAGENWAGVIIWLKNYGCAVFFILISVFVGYQIYFFVKRKCNVSI